MKYREMLCCYSNLHVLQALEQLKSEESKRNRFGDVREESLVQESETREAGLLTKIADLESDLKIAKKGERRVVNEVERLLSQNGGLLKEVDKQHDELKKVMSKQTGNVYYICTGKVSQLSCSKIHYACVMK